MEAGFSCNQQTTPAKGSRWEKSKGILMKKAPLIDKRCHDLGVAIQANITQASIPEEDLDFHLEHKDGIRDAIRDGFVRQRFFDGKEAKIGHELLIAQRYAAEHLGWFADGNLKDMFVIPTVFPWKSVTAVFIPRGLSPMSAAKGLRELVPVECRHDLSGFKEYSQARLFFVHGHISGDPITKKKSADQLRQLGYYKYLDLTALLVAIGTNKFGHPDEHNLRDFLNSVVLLLTPDSIHPDGRTMGVSGMMDPNGANITAHGGSYVPDYGGAVLAIEAQANVSYVPK